MGKLTILVSSRDSHVRLTVIKIILTEYLNRKIKNRRFEVTKQGKDFDILDCYNNNEYVMVSEDCKTLSELITTYPVKIFNFDDIAADICENLFGLDYAQCHGTNEDRHSPTHIVWEDLFTEIREKYSRPRRGTGGTKPASGLLNSAELLGVLSGDILRRIDPNCIARALYKNIEEEECELSIINGGKNASEISLGTEIGCKAIRVIRSPLRSDTLDSLSNFPLGEFSLVIDLSSTQLKEISRKLIPKLDDWFITYGI